MTTCRQFACIVLALSLTMGMSWFTIAKASGNEAASKLISDPLRINVPTYRVQAKIDIYEQLDENAERLLSINAGVLCVDRKSGRSSWSYKNTAVLNDKKNETSLEQHINDGITNYRSYVRPDLAVKDGYIFIRPVEKSNPRNTTTYSFHEGAPLFGYWEGKSMFELYNTGKADESGRGLKIRFSENGNPTGYTINNMEIVGQLIPGNTPDNPTRVVSSKIDVNIVESKELKPGVFVPVKANATFDCKLDNGKYIKTRFNYEFHDYQVIDEKEFQESLKLKDIPNGTRAVMTNNPRMKMKWVDGNPVNEDQDSGTGKQNPTGKING